MISRVSGSDGTKAEVAMEILNFFLLYMIVDEGYWLESHLTNSTCTPGAPCYL